MAESTTIFSGLCQKQGTGSSLFGGKGWKQRYIEIDYAAKTLKYFEQTPQVGNAKSFNHLKAPIDLEGYKLLVASEPKADFYELSLAKEGSKSLTLRFPNVEERATFIEAFAKAGVSTEAVSSIASPPPTATSTEGFKPTPENNLDDLEVNAVVEEVEVPATSVAEPAPVSAESKSEEVSEAPAAAPETAPEAPVAEAPVAEPPKPEAPAAEEPKPEAPAAEEPKPEAPAAEEPKPEAESVPAPPEVAKPEPPVAEVVSAPPPPPAPAAIPPPPPPPSALVPPPPPPPSA